jgi:hypothetical protein
MADQFYMFATMKMAGSSLEAATPTCATQLSLRSTVSLPTIHHFFNWQTYPLAVVHGANLWSRRGLALRNAMPT